jgi:hypothetical protein
VGAAFEVDGAFTKEVEDEDAFLCVKEKKDHENIVKDLLSTNLLIFFGKNHCTVIEVFFR